MNDDPYREDAQQRIERIEQMMEDESQRHIRGLEHQVEFWREQSNMHKRLMVHFAGFSFVWGYLAAYFLSRI